LEQKEIKGVLMREVSTLKLRKWVEEKGFTTVLLKCIKVYALLLQGT
jgi:hypothetical protein